MSEREHAAPPILTSTANPRFRAAVSLRPALMAMTGLTRAAERAADMNLRAWVIASM